MLTDTDKEELLQAITRTLDEVKAWDVNVSRPPILDTESPEAIATRAKGWESWKPGPAATIVIRVRYDDQPLSSLGPVPPAFSHSEVQEHATEHKA